MAEETRVEREDKFYACLLNHEGQFSVEEFATLEELQIRLTALIDQDVSVFSFVGAQLKISKPPFRHLLTPWGAKPLFVVPTDELEPDDTGYLGVDPVHFEAPPQVRMPQRAAPEDDDVFFGQDDKVTGMFDGVLPDPDGP
jgi:hypothetical protein